MTSTILFVCTGNVYRSRFAEALFNHHAGERGLSWIAFSRGLATHQAAGIDLAEATMAALAARGIARHHTGPTRNPLTEDDLQRADRRIALSHAEHRPMVTTQFPEWLDRFTFWEVEDIPHWRPEQALPAIERAVLALLEDLASPDRP